MASTDLLLIFAVVVGIVSVNNAQVALSDDFVVSNGSHILNQNGVVVYPKAGQDSAGRIVGIAVDQADRYIFWSDVESKKRGIYRSDLNGNNAQKIVSDVLEVNGLTVDWVSNHIYWTDARRGSIEVADYDGANQRTLIDTGLTWPRGIVANPLNGTLFWNDQGTRKLERSLLDGSDRTELITDGLSWPNMMAIDFTSGLLSWVDGANKTLNTCDQDGNNWQIFDLASPASGNVIYGLANGAKKYITVWGSGKVIDKSGAEILSLDSDRVFGIQLTSRAGNQPSGSNNCKNNNGGCSHLCLPTGVSTRRCACPTKGALTLQSETVCHKPNKVLLYAHAELGEVGLIDLSSNRYPGDKDRYIVGRSTRPVAVAYDPVDEIVYWSDVLQRRIMRANLNGSNPEVFIDSDRSLGIVDGLSVDYRHRSLYFSNMGFQSVGTSQYSWHKIEMVSLGDSSKRKTIINMAEKPRDVWVDVENNKLYFSDWGDNSHITRTSLDGNEVEVLLNKEKVANPNGILVDGGDLYIADSNFKNQDTAKLMKYSSGNVEEIPVPGLHDYTPFGLAKDGDTLYISDWNSKKIVSYNLNTKQQTDVLTSMNSKPMGLLVTRISQAQGSNPCARANCEEICVVSASNQPVCSCPSYSTGVIGSDKKCEAAKNFILFADMNRIGMIELDTGKNNIKTIVEGNGIYSNFVALAYDHKSKTIFYSDVNRRWIYKANIDGTSSEVFYQPNHIIDSMVLKDDRLYWTDFYNGVIASVALSGHNSTYKVHAENRHRPRAIQVTDSHIYWTEWGNNTGVFRISTSGESNVNQIIMNKDSGLKWPNGLHVHGDYLYVADGSSKTVMRSRINVFNDGKAMVKNKAKHYYDIHVDPNANWVYYSDWTSSAIGITDMDTGVNKEVATGLIRPTQLVIHVQSLRDNCQPSSVCPTGAVCTSVPGTFLCRCGEGQSFENGKCVKEVPKFCCPADITKSTQGELNVSWADPTLCNDPEVTGTQLESNPESGSAFKPGTHLVQYFNAKTKICNFNVIVTAIPQTNCGNPPNPRYGGVTCSGSPLQCELSCNGDYVIDTQIWDEHNVQCQSGSWVPKMDRAKLRTTFCILPVPPINFNQVISIKSAAQCKNEEQFRKKVSDGIRADLQNAGLWISYVNVDTTITVLPCATRKKRSDRLKRQTDSLNINMVISATFDKTANIADHQNVMAKIKAILTFLKTYKLVIDGVETSVDVQPLPFTITCHKNYIRRGSYCAPCQPGTFFRNGNCDLCPKNQYQNRVAQSSCVACADGKTTEYEGSINRLSCKSPPPPKSEDNIGLIVGIAVGVVVLLIIVIIIVVVLILRRKRGTPVPKEDASLEYENRAYEEIPADKVARGEAGAYPMERVQSPYAKLNPGNYDDGYSSLRQKHLDDEDMYTDPKF